MTIESPNMIPPEALELTSENIHRMSPAEATAALAKLQAKYTAENPVDKNTRDGWLTMTPAEATAALAKLSGRPTDAEGKAIPLPPFTGITSSVELDARRAEETKTYLEERHFPARGTPEGDDLWNMIEGRTVVTAEVERAVTMKLAQFHADQAWVKRLMEGDARTMREWQIATGIIAAAKIQRETR